MNMRYITIIGLLVLFAGCSTPVVKENEINTIVLTYTGTKLHTPPDGVTEIKNTVQEDKSDSWLLHSWDFKTILNGKHHYLLKIDVQQGEKLPIKIGSCSINISHNDKGKISIKAYANGITEISVLKNGKVQSMLNVSSKTFRWKVTKESTIYENGKGSTILIFACSKELSFNKEHTPTYKFIVKLEEI
jgi:hypothetical protein